MKTKRITLLAVIILTINFGCMHAQTNQGKVLIGLSSPLSFAGTGSDLMNFGYSIAKEKSDADDFEEEASIAMTGLNISPMVGYYILDNFAVGLNVNYALTSRKKNDKISQTLFRVGPFVRYYIPMTRILPFIELSSSFGRINTNYDFDENSYIEDREYKSRLMTFGGGIGFAVPLGERVTFDILAGYDSSTVKDKEDNEDNERLIISTLGLKFGFTILLGTN